MAGKITKAIFPKYGDMAVGDELMANTQFVGRMGAICPVPST